MAHDDALYWPAFKDAGMLELVAVLLPDSAAPTDVDVIWREPSVDTLGNRSRDYEMEYQRHDLPTLREGCQVRKGGVMFKVREDPYVVSGDGYFMRALLTRIGVCS